MRLYSLGQIVLATFLGGPFAGAWLLGLDQRALKRKSRWTFLVGVLVQLGLIPLVFILPSSTPRYAVPLAYVTLMRFIADGLVGVEIRQHLETGGQRSSWGKAVGVGLASMAVWMLLALGALLFGPEQLVHVVRYGNGAEISYEDGATRAEAKAAAAAMEHAHMTDAAVTITLSHNGDKLVMRTALDDEDRKNAKLIAAWRRVFAMLANDAFPDRTVETGTTDLFATRNYPLEPLGLVSRPHILVFYEPRAGKQLAQKLAAASGDPGKGFVKTIVDRDGERCIVSFIIVKPLEEKLDDVARELSTSICDGKPVTLRLTSDGVDTLDQVSSDH
jgi:hypothetical protein